VGKRAAVDVFKRFPGTWEVYQVAENELATAFWRAVIREYTGGEYDEVNVELHGIACVQQRFRSSTRRETT